MKKKPKKLKYVPPTPEQRLITLRHERDGLMRLVAQRHALGDFDANSATIRATLHAAIDVIDYLISLNEQDHKNGR